MTRRIMKEFVIEELSCVDRPAQEGARAVLFKRDPREPQMTFGNFDDAVLDIQKRAGLSPLEALQRAAREFPELRERDRYADGHQSLVKAAPAEAIRKFYGLVEDIQLGERCSSTEALERARRRHPREFQAFQSA